MAGTLFLSVADILNLTAAVAIAYSPFLLMFLLMGAVAVVPGRLRAKGGAAANPEEGAIVVDETELALLCSRLRETDVFEGLTDHELRLVASVGRRRAVTAGERLAHAGSRGADIYTIFSGELRLLTRRGETESAVRVAGPRETVPLAALLDPPLLVTTIEAATDGEVFAIPRARLVDLCEIQPMIGLQVYRATAKAFEHRYRKTLDDLAASLQSVLDFSRLGAGVAH